MPESFWSNLMLSSKEWLLLVAFAVVGFCAFLTGQVSSPPLAPSLFHIRGINASGQEVLFRVGNGLGMLQSANGQLTLQSPKEIYRTYTAGLARSVANTKFWELANTIDITSIETQYIVYRNGIRQELGQDYLKNPANPRQFGPAKPEITWAATDRIITEFPTQ